MIVRFSSLGDVILTTPLIRSLKNKYPEIEIDFCIKNEYVDVLRYNPYIRSIIVYTNTDGEISKLRETIIGNDYDLIIDLQNNYRSKTLLQGIKKPVQKFIKHSFLKFLLVRFKVNLMSRMPQIPVRYAKTLRNFELDKQGLDLFLPKDIKADLPPGNNYIALCPGSKHYTKMWPYDYYIELGEILRLHDYTVVVFGGKMEKELCKTIAAKIPGAIDVCNDDNLYKTAANMQMCSAVVSNDSGLIHIASALQKPILAIFGSTVKEFGFTPYRTKNKVIQDENLSCRPCSHIGRANCPKKHFHCMLRLTPIAVYQNLSYLMSAK